MVRAEEHIEDVAGAAQTTMIRRRNSMSLSAVLVSTQCLFGVCIAVKGLQAILPDIHAHKFANDLLVSWIGGQSSTVGMLPPSDSEEEDDEDGGERAEAKAKPSKASSSHGQNRNAGKLPPSGSEDEDDEDDEEDSEEESSEEPLNEYLASSAPRKK